MRSGLPFFACVVLFARAGFAGEPTRRLSPWQSDRHTFFVASAHDFGILYARPHATLGWGAPFWQFVGLDAYAITSNSFAAAYAGLRACLPWLDVQWGYRATYAYSRRALAARDTYRAEDLELRAGDERSTYTLIELEITPGAPVLHGVAFAEIHPMWFFTPRDRRVYEESTRVVAASPFELRTRLGYMYSLDEDRSANVGGMLEYFVLPGRPENVLRAGPLAILRLSRYLEGLATVTLVVTSPDDLGPNHGTFGFLGLRGRLAQRL